MSVQISQESKEDYLAVELLIEQAFANEVFSDKQEHILVAKLRTGDGFVSELSLVAKVEDVIVGYILFTKAKVVQADGDAQTLALAPLAVAPKFQRSGIGTMLTQYGLNKARELGFGSVFVLGDPEYYTKFGFIEAFKHSVIAPFEIESKYFMVLELQLDALKSVSGVLKYAKEFGV